MTILKIGFITILFILFLYPLKAFAHGSSADHAGKNLGFGNISLYIVIGAAILLILFIFIWIILKGKMKTLNIRKREEREKAAKLNHLLKGARFGTAIWVVITIVAGGVALANKESNVSFMHIHGLDFSSNGKQLFVPSHDGLRVFEDTHWEVAKSEPNDYMGFSMADDGFYSSGHPGEGSDLQNPVGIIKSKDNGNTLKTLSLAGESDFHVMDNTLDTEPRIWNESKACQHTINRRSNIDACCCLNAGPRRFCY
ncbi:hypothetical protein EV207_11411 [Scopulibacillus darangshiensis]|uniref:Uncharacterized protein n=1 Tax=Scopulibacillus darangshiensis TaxID=442528 RepID=A0A4R2P2D8_9BACL|nr:hypothetical protein [Scopulibacillus darangshiensis]TCP28889.1 hypothetical protein EV207_11411 [Scopulibacillus darangshiensis]